MSAMVSSVSPASDVLSPEQSLDSLEDVLFDDSSVVVTSAASPSGSAVCARLVAAGVPVVGIDSSEDVFDVVSSALYQGFTADLTDAEDVSAVAEVVGPVAHLVSLGAPVGVTEALWDAAGKLPVAQDFVATVCAGVASHYVPLYAFWDSLTAASPDRSVTFVQSVHAVRDLGLPAFSSVQASLSGLMVSLLGMAGAAGVRVNTVLYASVVSSETQVLTSGTDPSGFYGTQVRSPLGRLANPTDVADAVFFVSQVSDLVNGATVVVDGGQLRSWG